MKLAKLLIALLVVALFVHGTASHCLGQDQKKKEQSKEEKELIARCKTKPIKTDPPREPKEWKWEKGETYRGGPVISYTIREDGSVTNAKLKRSSGVRKIDEYYLALVKGRKYEAMPGCPGVDTTEDILIHFQ